MAPPGNQNTISGGKSTLKTNNENTVSKDLVTTLMQVCSFFMKHSVIEFDGESKSVKVFYNGPSGWRLSLQSSHALPEVEADKVEEV